MTGVPFDEAAIGMGAGFDISAGIHKHVDRKGYPCCFLDIGFLLPTSASPVACEIFVLVIHFRSKLAKKLGHYF